MNFCPIGRGCLARDLAENTIELRQRLEARLERRLADALVRVEQKIPHLFHAHAGKVVGKSHARRLLEHFAEVKRTHVDRLGDLVQRQIVRMFFRDVSPRPGDGRGLGILLPHDKLASQNCEMLRENRQQAKDGVILFFGNNTRLEESLLQFFQVHIRSKFEELAGRMGKLFFRRLMQQDLTRLQKSHQVFPHADRHRGIAQTRETFESLGLKLSLFLDSFLQLQAGGARLVALGHDRAKWILVGVVMMRKIKRLECAEIYGQARCVTKGLLVVMIDLRTFHLFDKNPTAFG